MTSLKSRPKEEAEEFVDQVKRLFTSRDDLIYRVESNISKPNVISPSTVGSYDAWVEITLYNVSDIESVYKPRYWVRVGEMGADFDIYRDYSEPSIEIRKRFD